MSESKPNPREMLALLLGASSFSRAPNLAAGLSFYLSAYDFQEYLIGVPGLNLPRENVHSLFDKSGSPNDQLQEISDFLESRFAALKKEGLQPQDLILYYVGHGLFPSEDHTYSLAIRETDEQNEGFTSIRASELASIIKHSARYVRKFLILDCCFSAAATKEFESIPSPPARAKRPGELPQRGTALLCSASAEDHSLAPKGLYRTMFSDSLLKALRSGHPLLGPWLSLSELRELVETNVREAYPSDWTRPEVHSPDQREGDVAKVPLFPNTAYLVQKAAAEESQKDESLRMRQGPDIPARSIAEGAKKMTPSDKNGPHFTRWIHSVNVIAPPALRGPAEALADRLREFPGLAVPVYASMAAVKPPENLARELIVFLEEDWEPGKPFDVWRRVPSGERLWTLDEKRLRSFLDVDSRCRLGSGAKESHY